MEFIMKHVEIGKLLILCGFAFAVAFSILSMGCQSDKSGDAANKELTETQKALIQDPKKKPASDN